MQSFHVGLPCLKLSLSPSTQKHHGKAAKTCSVGDAWKEMNDEREGRDKTIDHELTKDNVWLCGSTDMDLEQVIQTEIDMINAKRAEFGKRKMRIDAVSAIELIQKPPMDVMTTLTREEQTQLLKDSDEVVESILRDWAPEWKTLATVIHYDEFGGKSGHPHKIFMPIAKDDDGCPVLNAKRDFNLQFFTFMNREYPARMREKGYPVLDCQIYEDMNEQEREAHSEKKKDYGLEGYEYKLKKLAEQEAKIEANERIIEDQTLILSGQETKITENEDVIAGQDDIVNRQGQMIIQNNNIIASQDDELEKIRHDAEKEIDKWMEEAGKKELSTVRDLKTGLMELGISESDYDRLKVFKNALEHPVRAKNGKTYVEVPDPEKTLGLFKGVVNKITAVFDKVRELTGRFTEKRERMRVSIKDKLRENTEKVKVRDESRESIRRKPEVTR